MNVHSPTPSLLPHVCSKCGGRDSDPTWHFMPHPAEVSPRRESSMTCGKCGHPMHWKLCGSQTVSVDPTCVCRNDVATVRPEPVAVARRTDPSTSWEAARSVTGIRESQEEVLFMFRQFGPMTDERAYQEYIDAHGRDYAQSVSGFRTRRSELVARGLLRDTGERRKGSTGRNMIVWAAA